MKLRNKKTGEIKNVIHNHVLIHFNDGETRCINSIGELNEEWEDYEEPKELYRLTSYGEAVRFSSDGISNAHKRECVNIGNYFKTREEAERAVEKLKAWKRLKDAGFKITGWANSIGDDYYKPSQIVIEMNNKPSFDEYDDIEPFRKDLDLLFGGEDS